MKPRTVIQRPEPFESIFNSILNEGCLYLWVSHRSVCGHRPGLMDLYRRAALNAHSTLARILGEQGEAA